MAQKVSIIIPVYNAEAYLAECLHSVIAQTFQEMEIILVDDGSTDCSPGIIRAFAEKDGRIKVITQPNGGVSAARNTGLHAAECEYILFVDSDDTILSNSVETLYSKACETESDLLLGGALWCYPEDGRQLVAFERNEELNEELNSLIGIPGEACYIKLMESGNAFPPLVYLFFMKRDLIVQNNLFFKEGIIHEDELWCIKAMLSASRVTMIDFNYYYYRQHEGSLMNSDNKGFRIKSLLIVAKEIKKLTQKLKREKKSSGLVGCLYTKIFRLAHCMNDLRRETEPDDRLSFLSSCFFSKLLLEIYTELPYEKQREYLTNYCY